MEFLVLEEPVSSGLSFMCLLNIGTLVTTMTFVQIDWYSVSCYYVRCPHLFRFLSNCVWTHGCTYFYSRRFTP